MSKTTIVKDFIDDNGNSISGVAAENFNVSIFFRGKNNKLIVEDGVKLRDTFIRFDAHNATIKIGSNTSYRGSIRAGLNCSVEIGRGLTVTEKCYMSCAENTSIQIGDDCMFASFNQLRTDDAHPIFDLDTKQRINVSKNIIIGCHVWLGYEAIVLGGTIIGSGSVVGIRSLLNKNYSSMGNNILLAGSPAKVIKKNIAWERTHVNLMPPFDFPLPVSDLLDFR